MSEKQQTAVDWLWDKLLEETETGELRYHLKHDIVKVFEQALAMEREQIKQARITSPITSGDIELDKEESEQYYNETYGK